MKWILCIGLLIAGSLGGAAAATPFTLVKDGKPACCIVIAEKPSYNAKAAARELQQYVEKISGAKLDIRNDSESVSGSKILVGRSKLTDAIKGLKIPDGITINLCEEGYVIRSTGDTLVLAGNDTEVTDEHEAKIRCNLGDEATMGAAMYLGTRYAVYDLLNRFGVRWFMPGEYGEVVPTSKTLQIPAMSVEEHPDFPIRHLAMGTDGEQMTHDYFMWVMHNRMNARGLGWFGLPADGTIGNLLPKDQIKAHPEWFALQPDGSRSPSEPCLSDEMRRNDPKYAGQPRLLDEIVKRIEYNAKFNLHVTDFAPEDGAPWCSCDLCRNTSYRFLDGMSFTPYQEYSTSQEYFTFVNQLLEATAEKVPGHLLATNGYFNRLSPPELGPSFNRHQNLTVMFADILACAIHGYNDKDCWQMQQQYDFLKRWRQLSDKVWIYGYPLVNTTGQLAPIARRMIGTIPQVKEAGGIGFMEGCPDLMYQGIDGAVLRFALEWNAKADTKAVLNDFYGKWFGPAAGPMQTYYNRLEDRFETAPLHCGSGIILQSMYTPQLMAGMADDMARAEAAAVSDPYKLRVRMERMQFDHLRSYVDFLQAQKELRFRAAASSMRQMLKLKKDMQKVTKFAGGYGNDYTGMQWQADRMERFASMQMLAPLSETARFRTDKHDLGRSQRWMEPGYNDSKWQVAGVCAGWQNQAIKDEDGLPTVSRDGHPYTGLGWYRFSVNVPALPEGKEARLFLPGVVAQAWVWVNGEYVGRSEQMNAFLFPQEFDVTARPYLKPGKNVITVRVFQDNWYIGSNGIYERPFLYSR